VNPQNKATKQNEREYLTISALERVSIKNQTKNGGKKMKGKKRKKEKKWRKKWRKFKKYNSRGLYLVCFSHQKLQDYHKKS